MRDLNSIINKYSATPSRNKDFEDYSSRKSREEVKREQIEHLTPLENATVTKKVDVEPKLSEEFIGEFKDKVDWGLISQYQKLFPEDFIKKEDKTFLSLPIKVKRNG